MTKVFQIKKNIDGLWYIWSYDEHDPSTRRLEETGQLSLRTKKQAVLCCQRKVEQFKASMCGGINPYNKVFYYLDFNSCDIKCVVVTFVNWNNVHNMDNFHVSKVFLGKAAHEEAKQFVTQLKATKPYYRQFKICENVSID